MYENENDDDSFLRKSVNFRHSNPSTIICPAEQCREAARLKRYHEGGLKIIPRLQTGRHDLGLLRGFPVIVGQNQRAIAIAQLESWVG